MQAADSIDADQTNTRESSTQENKAEQEQRSGGYQTLKINPPPSSPKNYEKPVDPVVPPRNVSHYINHNSSCNDMFVCYRLCDQNLLSQRYILSHRLHLLIKTRSLVTTLGHAGAK